MRKAYLFRWHRHWQLDMPCASGWLSLGLSWRYGVRPIAYWSPDATPVHPRAKGLRRA